MTEYNIFCYAKTYNDKDSFQQKRYRAFNKEVGEDRYNEIVRLIKHDILKGLKLELNNNPWKEEWKKVTKDQWKRLSGISEFDKEVVEGIIGFELDISDKQLTLEERVEILEKNLII